MRQLNDRPKSQTAKTSSEQVPYRSLVCKHKSSFAALLLLFPKSLRLFGNPYTSERLMYCGALGQHSACRQAGVPVGTLTRRKRQAKNYFKKGRKRIWNLFRAKLRTLVCKPPVNCSVTHKPLDNKNNGTCYDCYQFVIKRLIEIAETRINTGFFKQLDLFKLNRPRRLTGNIIEAAVYPLHFIDNPAHNSL